MIVAHYLEYEDMSILCPVCMASQNDWGTLDNGPCLSKKRATFIF